MRSKRRRRAAPVSCTNCGDAQVGVYCARCGEKQPHHHDLTMGHLAHDVFHELVHLDSTIASIAYLFLGLRRYYGQGGAKNGVKSVLAWAGMFATSMLLIFGSLMVAVAQVL